MKNISYGKILRTGAVQIHVEPSPIQLIKSKYDKKMEKYDVKIILHRDPMS